MQPSDVPAVSVIMPCFNAAAYLRESLASVLAQAFADLEIILVDDGSTDDPVSIIHALADDRIRYTRTPPSGGPAQPRNLGLKQARGRYVFFFDADDVMMPGKIEAQVARFADQESLGLNFTNFRVVDDEGKTLRANFLAGYDTFQELLHRMDPRTGSFVRSDFYLSLLRANFVGTSGVAVRRDVLSRVGGFDTGLASSEDLDLWLRIARDFDCAYVDVIGHAYRTHGQSVMHQFQARHPLARIEVINRHLPGISDPLTRRVMRRRLADNYVSLGYIWQVRGDAARARGNYAAAFRVSPTVRALGGYLKCLVGRPFLRDRGKGLG